MGFLGSRLPRSEQTSKALGPGRHGGSGWGGGGQSQRQVAPGSQNPRLRSRSQPSASLGVSHLSSPHRGKRIRRGGARWGLTGAPDQASTGLWHLHSLQSRSQVSPGWWVPRGNPGRGQIPGPSPSRQPAGWSKGARPSIPAWSANPPRHSPCKGPWAATVLGTQASLGFGFSLKTFLSVLLTASLTSPRGHPGSR